MEGLAARGICIRPQKIRCRHQNEFIVLFELARYSECIQLPNKILCNTHSAKHTYIYFKCARSSLNMCLRCGKRHAHVLFVCGGGIESHSKNH